MAMRVVWLVFFPTYDDMLHENYHQMGDGKTESSSTSLMAAR